MFYSEGATYDTCFNVGWGICFNFGMGSLPEKKPALAAVQMA